MNLDEICQKNNRLRDHMLSLANGLKWRESIKLSQESLNLIKNEPWISNVEKIVIFGHGTSLAASMISASWFSHISRINSQALPAYQFKNYMNDYLIDPSKTLVIAISCSGKTPNVIEGLEKANQLGAVTMCISGSGDVECAKVAKYLITTKAHEDIEAGIPVYTNSYIYLLLGVYHLAIMLGEKRKQLDSANIDYWQQGLEEVIENSAHIVSIFNQMQSIVTSIRNQCGRNFVVLGTGPNYGTMIEGALKISEFSWMFGAGEELEDFAHGRFREVDSSIPLLIISPGETTHEKTLDILVGCNISKTPTVVFTQNRTSVLDELSTHVLDMPRLIDEYVTPFMYVFPLWFFGFHMRQLDGKLVGEIRHGLLATDISYRTNYRKLKHLSP